MSSKQVLQVVLQTLQYLMLGGAALGVLIGFALIVDSARMFRISETLDRWISTKEALQPLDTSYAVERSVYRHHRIAGSLIVVAALYVLSFFVLNFHSERLVTALRRLLDPRMGYWLVESARYFFILVNLAAVVIGVLMLVRPSRLKSIESWANRYYSDSKATQLLEAPHWGADRFTRRRPRLVGVLLIAGGGFVLVAMTLLHMRLH
jgi:hypothetical protein